MRKIELLKEINKHKINDLDLGEGFVLPKYLDQSILNVPSSICRLLDIPSLPSPPLGKEYLSVLGDDVENVIYILVDAMAYQRLRDWMEEDGSLIWNKFRESGVFAPITSISPSTTSAAITTFWSGTTPSEHGVTGYEMWMKEYGMIANMILHRPASFRGGSEGLEFAGFEADSFLPVKKFGTHLSEHGVSAHSFQHYSISKSGLSQSFLQDAELHGTSTLPDVWISLREMLESKQGEKTYSWVYWGDYDGSAHFFGPDAERPKADFMNFSQVFEEYFLGRIGKELKENTVVIVGADHGQIWTDKKNDDFDLKNHPEFLKLLQMQPTGENRLAFLYVRPGKIEDVRNYISKTWPEQFTVVDSGKALSWGLFGSGPFHKNIQSRIGDLIVIAKGDAYLWWADKPNPLTGRHGGLSDQEMIVPFLAARLDK